MIGGEEDNKEAVLTLLKADAEPEVMGLFKEAGYWDDSKVWNTTATNPRIRPRWEISRAEPSRR